MSHDRLNWIAIRTAFVVRGWTYEKCAEEFGVHVTTIKKRGSKEKWTDIRHQNTTQGGEAVAKEMRDATRDALALHASLADQLAEAVRAGIEEISSMPAGRSKAETIKVLAEAADKAVRLGRDVRGIRPGESSADTNEAETSVRIIREVVAPEAASAHA